MKVIRRSNSTLFSFDSITSSKYGNLFQWDRLTGLVRTCVVLLDWWWWLSCLAVLWPDSLECLHSWQKCLRTTAAAMRISIHAIAFHDLHRLRLVLVHILHRKMARQGMLDVGYTEDWQGKRFLQRCARLSINMKLSRLYLVPLCRKYQQEFTCWIKNH